MSFYSPGGRDELCEPGSSPSYLMDFGGMCHRLCSSDGTSWGLANHMTCYGRRGVAYLLFYLSRSYLDILVGRSTFCFTILFMAFSLVFYFFITIFGIVSLSLVASGDRYRFIVMCLMPDSFPTPLVWCLEEVSRLSSSWLTFSSCVEFLLGIYSLLGLRSLCPLLVVKGYPRVASFPG